MTLEYIIKQAFNYGYFQGTWDADHDADKHAEAQAAIVNHFARELGGEDLKNWDIHDLQLMRWERGL